MITLKTSTPGTGMTFDVNALEAQVRQTLALAGIDYDTGKPFCSPVKNSGVVPGGSASVLVSIPETVSGATAATQRKPTHCTQAPAAKSTVFVFQCLVSPDSGQNAASTPELAAPLSFPVVGNGDSFGGSSISPNSNFSRTSVQSFESWVETLGDPKSGS